MNDEIEALELESSEIAQVEFDQTDLPQEDGVKNDKITIQLQPEVPKKVFDGRP